MFYLKKEKHEVVSNILSIKSDFFCFFVRFIQTMRDDLSEVGQARAWIHLGLEKKMLSQHLKELLTNQELLRSQFTDRFTDLC